MAGPKIAAFPKVARQLGPHQLLVKHVTSHGDTTGGQHALAGAVAQAHYRQVKRPAAKVKNKHILRRLDAGFVAVRGRDWLPLKVDSLIARLEGGLQQPCLRQPIFVWVSGKADGAAQHHFL